ncbi:hypothetical protein, partial [Nostoc sp. CALU 1950]|uniref:hypothetical protein n=1 Tax=Nostoc sp. CALU 1950 TaxID=3104321 RepID=UPI003EBF681C
FLNIRTQYLKLLVSPLLLCSSAILTLPQRFSLFLVPFALNPSVLHKKGGQDARPTISSWIFFI